MSLKNLVLGLNSGLLGWILLPQKLVIAGIRNLIMLMGVDGCLSHFVGEVGKGISQPQSENNSQNP